MAISERLAYILTFDVDGGVKSLQKVGATADKEFGKVESRLDKVGANMVKIGAGAMAFAGIAGAGLFKMAMGAADAAAGMEALEQVVGEAVAHDIEKWARGSARGVGLASKDAVDAATSFAMLGKRTGLAGQDLSRFSTGLVGVAADFAAFKNRRPEEALAAIQSGFAGATMPLRQFGIYLDEASLKQAYFRETGERVIGTLTAEQRIIATNSELYRQGADMLGQWAREADQAVSQQAILRAELTNAADAIGAGVLPMVLALMTSITDLASGFASLSEATGGWLGKAAGVAVVAIGIGGALLFAAGKAIQLRTSISDTVTRLGDFAKAHPKMVAASVGIGAALVVAAAAFNDIAATRAFNEAQIQSFTDARKALAELNSEASAFKVWIAETEKLETRWRPTNGPLGIFSAGTRDALPYIQAAGVTIEELTAAVERGGDAYDRASNKIEHYYSKQNVSIEGMEQAQIALKALKEAHDDYATSGERHAEMEEWKTSATGLMADAVRDAGAALVAAADATKDATESAEEHEAALKAQTDALNAEIKALEDSAKALQDKIDGQRAATDSTYAAIQAQFDLLDAIAGTSEAMTEGTELTREHIEASLKLRDAAQKLADAKVREAEDQAKASGRTLSATRAIDIQNRSLLDTAATLNGPQRRAVLDHIARLNNIPESRMTEIRAAMDAGDIAEAERLLKDVSRTRSTAVRADRDQRSINETEAALNHLTRARTVRVNAAGISVGGGSSSQQRIATGTHFARGGIATVGEFGQEEVELPRGAKVHNAAQTRRRRAERAAAAQPSAPAGNTYNMTVNLPAGSRPNDVADAMRRYERIQGPL